MFLLNLSVHFLELVYLFLAIAIGLGYAAGQILITTVLISVILLIIFVWLSNRNLSSINEYNLVINWKKQSLEFNDLLDQLKSCSKELKLVRLDKSPTEATAVMLVTPEGESFLELITKKLRSLDEDMVITFFEAKTNW